MVLWEGYVSDETMGTFAPIVVYWLYAGCYQLLLSPLHNFRLHTLPEQHLKNLVPLSTVVKGVLLQQFVQVSIARVAFLLTSSSSVDRKAIPRQPSIPIQIVQIFIAMLVFDACQYFAHRYMHHNKFLYRHVHSQHHRLIVPYAVGALYNHPVEAFSDTMGGAVAFLVSGMSPRTSVWFFCLATVKTVDDHCGLWLPAGNIFHRVLENNSAYHDVHHQVNGIKYNYSQPFFSIWDRLLGTHMPYYVVKRAEGGYEVRMKTD